MQNINVKNYYLELFQLARKIKIKINIINGITIRGISL